MTKALDLVDLRFERLTVIQRVENDKHGKTRWLCKCDCGNKAIVGSGELKKGNTKSCGCYFKEKISERDKSLFTTHGMSKTRLFNILDGIKQRCDNPNSRAYKWYGLKGIKLCDEWYDLGVFAKWAMGNGYTEKLSLDRIDTNGNYEPSNCRWATMREQANNRTSNKIYTVLGITDTMTNLCRKFDKNKNAVDARIRKGWDLERAFTAECAKYKDRVTS